MLKNLREGLIISTKDDAWEKLRLEKTSYLSYIHTKWRLNFVETQKYDGYLPFSEADGEYG